MKKLVLGIFAAVLGVIFLASAGHNPQGPTGSIIIGLLCLGGGGMLIFFGSRYLHMECPSCHYKLSAFSKAVNKFGKKMCPECGKSLKVKIGLSKYSLIILPLVFVVQFALRGMVKSIVVGILVALMFYFSMELVETETETEKSK